MDVFMVDITDTEANIGDEVIIIGSSKNQLSLQDTRFL